MQQIIYWKRGVKIGATIAFVVVLVINSFYFMWASAEGGDSIMQYLSDIESWQIFGLLMLIVFLPGTVLGMLIGLIYGKIKKQSLV